MNGELNRSTHEVYNEVVRMKEKHYPIEVIQRNKDKVDYYNGRLYNVIRVFVDDVIPSPDYDVAATNDAVPVGFD